MGSPTAISEITLPEIPGTKLDRTEALKIVEFDFARDKRQVPNPQPNEIHLWVEHAPERTLTVETLLSRYVSLEDRDILKRLSKGPKGKPELQGSELRFNLSSTQGLTIAAVAFQRKLGVDSERIRPLDKWESIAKKYFGDDVALALANESDESRVLKMMEYWTLTEAWIKAQGTGVFDRPGVRFPDPLHWRAFRLQSVGYTSVLVIER